MQLKFLEARLRDMDMGIRFSDAAESDLAKAGFDPVYGARPPKRAIQQQIENPLSKLVLEGYFGPKDTIVADATNGVLHFEKEEESKKVEKAHRAVA